jgi:hypothetical protein
MGKRKSTVLAKSRMQAESRRQALTDMVLGILATELDRLEKVVVPLRRIKIEFTAKSFDLPVRRGGRPLIFNNATKQRVRERFRADVSHYEKTSEPLKPNSRAALGYARRCAEEAGVRLSKDSDRTLIRHIIKPVLDELHKRKRSG